MRDSVRTRLVALLVATVATSVVLRASQEAEPTPVEPVHLDFVVTDGEGRLIDDLGSADIEVRDDGVAQDLETVEFVSMPPRGNERVAAARPDGRLIGILLDEFHVSPENTARVRESVGRFVDEHLRPEDQVLVVKPLDSLSELHVSRNRAEIDEKVRTFEGRKGDYEPRSEFEATYMSRASSAADPQRARVVLSALASMAVYLGELREGRKTLIFVSEGFARVRQRGRLRGAGIQTIVRSADRADVAIYTLNPEPPVDPATVDAPAPSEGGDPGRASGDDGPSSISSMLRTLAYETGGASVDAAGIDAGLALAVRDLDGYYRAVFRSTHEGDGLRHTLDVQVDRPGAVVRVRSGHWTIPAVIVRSPEDSLTSALRRRVQQFSPFIRPWFGTSRGADGNTRLRFTWEANTRMRPPADTLTLTAVGANGDVLFDNRVDPIRTVGVGGEPTMSASFDAPPGPVLLDMTILGADGRMLGADVRDLNLPDLSGPGTILTPPEIFRTRSARQFRTLSADLQAPPVVSRSFSRTERLLIRVRAYAAEGHDLDVSARLMSRRNQTLRELPRLAAAPADDVTQFDLPLSSLAVGEYGIEIGADELREVILFEVTN